MPTRRRTVTATDAKNGSGSMLREVGRTGGPIVVERAGRPVTVLLGIEAYGESRSLGSKAGPSRAALARKAFEMWAEREDIGEGWLAEGRARWRSGAG